MSDLKQLQPVVQKIGNCEFYITPFPAFTAAHISGDLVKTLGPLVGAAVSLFSGRNSDDSENGKVSVGSAMKSVMDMDIADIMGVVSSCSLVDGDAIEKLCRKLLLSGNVAVRYEEDGEEHQARLDSDLANEVFCGEIQDMFVLCYHVIQINFKGFFRKAAGLFGEAESATPTKTRRIV